MKSLESLEKIKSISQPYFFEQLRNEFWDRYLLHNQYPDGNFKWDGRDSYTINFASKQSNESGFTERLSDNVASEVMFLFKNLRNSILEDFVRLGEESKEKRLLEAVQGDLEMMIRNLNSENTPEFYSDIIKGEFSRGISSIKNIDCRSRKNPNKRLGTIFLEKIDSENYAKFKSFYKALTEGGFIPKGSSAKLRIVFDGANLSKDNIDLRIEWGRKATEAKFIFDKLSNKTEFPHISIKYKWKAVTNNFKILNESETELDSESIRVVGDIPKEKEKELNSILETLRN